MMKRRALIVSVALTVLFAMMIEGCTINVNLPKSEGLEETEGSEETAAETEETSDEEGAFTGGGSPWIDSDMKENVTGDTPTDPRDDFHLYANKEWILENEIPEGYMGWSHYDERELEVKKQCMELLKDDSLEGHDADLVRTYNALILDWDARDASGVSEIEDIYKKLLAINSTDDIDSLYEDKDIQDELSTFFDFSANIGFNDPELYVVAVDTPGLLLNDSAEYTERSEYGDMYYGFRKDLFTYIAGRLGMTDEEASKCFDDAISFETKLADHIYTTKEQKQDDHYEKINNEMTLDELTDHCSAFPLRRILDTAGYSYDGNYLVYQPDYFDRLDELYTDENIDEIRSCLIVKYLLVNAQKLDRETYDQYNSAISRYFGTSGRLQDEEMAYNEVANSLPASMQKVYIKKYGSEEDKKKMEDLCRQVIDTYRELLSENEWASDEVKEYAIKKLDNIVIHAAYPDKFRDTSDIDIDGCSLIEAKRRIDRCDREYNRSLIGTKIDKEMWAEGFNILTCNAYYDFTANTINMIIGMMGEPFYSSDMSTEELYASIGAFWVGHEVSHAFDSTGAQFDENGRLKNWWTEEDSKEFKRRVGKMDDYLDGIVAFGDEHFIGTNVDTEMDADMTGLQCALRMASKVDDFDYDKFFKKYAQLNAILMLYSSELSNLKQDEHPLYYSRTNVPVQQFEEFYETYGVKEGDNMYLAPEDRLILW